MPKRATAAATPSREAPLRLVKPKEVGEVPLLTLGQGLDLYGTLQEHLKDLERYAAELRREILDAMTQQNVDQVSGPHFEATRQVRHSQPRLNADRAVDLLRRFHRLDEAMVQALDEQRARSIIDDLRARGLISDGELPYEPAPETEALIVRAK